MNREMKVDFIPMPDSLRDKYQYQTRADIGKILNAGYTKPIRSLESGIGDFVPYLEKDFAVLNP